MKLVRVSQNLRTAAIRNGQKTYETGRPCVRGHLVPRYTSTSQCMTCVAEYAIKWRAKNREDNLAQRLANIEKRKAKHAKWLAGKKERDAKRFAQYRENNREKVRLASAKWRSNNAAKTRATRARRRARLLRATPPWADQAEIGKIYAEAARASAAGIPHHVDHIIPLKGDGVCGLHVPWNLRVIPADENMAKSNR